MMHATLAVVHRPAALQTLSHDFDAAITPFGADRRAAFDEVATTVLVWTPA